MTNLPAAQAKTFKPAMTSIELAKTLKIRHDNMLRDIYTFTENCTVEFNQLNFELSYYTSSQNKELPMFMLSGEAVLLLTAARTGKGSVPLKEKVATKIAQIAEERQYLLEERNKTLQLEHDRMAYREPRAVDTLPVILGIASKDARAAYKHLVEEGYLTETKHESVSYSYSPTEKGSEYVKAKVGRTLRFKNNVTDLF